MLGIMHYDRDGAPAFVFDMMEPERPKVDRAVLGVPQVGGVASGGFHDPRGWGRKAQSGVGEDRVWVGSPWSSRSSRLSATVGLKPSPSW